MGLLNPKRFHSIECPHSLFSMGINVVPKFISQFGRLGFNFEVQLLTYFVQFEDFQLMPLDVIIGKIELVIGLNVGYTLSN